MSKKHPATTRVLLEAVRGGLPYKFAAKLAGIHIDTLKNWRTSDPLFSRELEAARAQFVQSHIKRIDGHSKRNWMASAWLLERTEARDFAPPHSQLSLTQNVANAPTNIVVVGPEKAAILATRHESIRARTRELLEQRTNGNGNGNGNGSSEGH